MMDLHTALAYLEHAEDFANTYEDKNHSALVSHQQRSTPNDAIDRIAPPRHANRPASYAPPAHSAKHTCERCGLKGHLPIVCEAPLPLASAYVRYQTYTPRPPRFATSNNSQRYPPRLPDAAGILHMTFLSVLHTWIVDSGATSHMTPNVTCFSVYNAFSRPENVRFGNGAYGQALGVGDITVHVPQGPIVLTHVLYVPSLVASLISVKRCMHNGCSVLFCAVTQTVKLYNNDGLMCEAIPQDGLIVLKTEQHADSDTDVEHKANVAINPKVLNWHKKLGHLGFDSLAKMSARGLLGSNAPKPSAFVQARDAQCEVCIRTKHPRNPHPPRDTKATQVCDRIHSDVSFFPTVSRTGHIGFVSFIDEATGKSIVRGIKRKSDVMHLTKQAIAYFETQSGHSVKCFRSDNGGEYLSAEFASYCADKGITHEFSSPYTPQQNGIAERFNQTIKARVRAMLDDCTLSHHFWPYVLDYACHIMNVSPKSGQPDTPHKAFHGTNAKMTHFHPFGCSVWVHVPREQRKSSLAPRSRQGYFLGISGPVGSKQNVVLVDKKVFVSSDVIFSKSDDAIVGRVERPVQDIIDYIAPRSQPASSLPSVSSSSASLQPSAMPHSDHVDVADDSDVLLSGQPGSTPEMVLQPRPFYGLPFQPSAIITPDVQLSQQLQRDIAGTPLPVSVVVPTHNSSPLSELPAPEPDPIYFTPNTEPVLYTNAAYENTHVVPDHVDIVPELSAASTSDDSSDDEEQLVQTGLNHRGSRVRNPPQFYRAHHKAALSIGEGTFDSKYEAFQLAFPHPTVPVFIPDISCTTATHSAFVAADPSSLSAATRDSNPDAALWSAAFDSEINSLRSKNVFTEVALPRYARAIGTRPLFVTKRNGDKKVRIVAQGFSQRPGTDYTDTFAPVCRYASLRSFIAQAAQLELTIRQLDVKVAFLNAALDEEVYVKPPLGYVSVIPHSVWHLHRALYGLKQAPRAWYIELRTKLAAHGFTPTHADPCLFALHDSDGNVLALILVYVDDCLIAAKSHTEVARIVSIISSIWEVRDLGEPTDFLGIQLVRHSASSISLHQSSYIDQLCALFGVNTMTPRVLPMDPKLQFVKDMGQPVEQPERYRKLVGALLHLTNCTRPDVSFAVNVLARYNQDPREAHGTAAIDLLRYVMGSSSLALTYGTGEGGVVYHDADFASSIDDRRSTSGYCVLLNGAAVSWASKKQPTVALSTMESEYQSAALCAREVMWLRYLWPTLGRKIEGPTVILGDNQACLSLCASHQVTAMAKHIDIIHHYATEQVQLGHITFKYVASSMNVADILTKALFKPLMEQHRQALGLHTLQA